MNARILFIVAAFLAAGCEQLGLEDPAKLAAAKEAEGKAIGSACRHSGRALEDCYDSNAKVSKAAIFAGWREMDGYMRENQIPTMSPGKAADAEPAAPAEEKVEAPGAKQEKKASPAAKPGAAKQTDATPAAQVPASGRRVRVTQVDGLDLGQDFA